VFLKKVLHGGRGAGMDQVEAVRVGAGFSRDGNGFVPRKK
jgi:hypothetical protein